MSKQTGLYAKEFEDRIYNKVLKRLHNGLEKDISDIKSHIKQVDERVEKLESSTTINADSHTWKCIGSGGVSTSPPPEDDPSVFQLSQDLYAILASASWRSIPFWLSALVIFGFQYLLVIVLLDNQVDVSADENKFNLPPNVEAPVRISQAMLIIIVFFSQRDMLDGIESLVRGLPDQFCGDSRFGNMTRLQWRLSSIVRLIQGLLTFLASYVLAVQSETVPDVLLNVLGVAFISDLDDVAFRLSMEGYLGGPMKRMSKYVCHVRFHRGDNLPSSVLISKKVKKDAHIISAFALVLVGLAVFSIIAIGQQNGEYIEHFIQVEFGDEVIPFLGLFNGCYRKSKSNEDIGGRLVYEQVGYPNGGKFGFCSDFGEGYGGWTFFIGEQDEDDCTEKGYILRSDDTLTFSLLEAGTTKWYTYDDLPMDYLEITENKASTTNCGQRIFTSSKDACPSILAFDTMNMAKLSPSLVDVDASSGTGLDASVSHPIYYYNNSGENGSFTLLFFTGRRWVRAESDHIQGIGKGTGVKDIEDFFYSHGGLFKLIDELRTSMDSTTEWVSAVSEIVDTTKDQGSPLGLLWYLPRYDEVPDDGTETATLRRNFPSANLARPFDSQLTCLFCNGETNPCLNNGTCNANGICSCSYGWTGKLCQEPPIGDGICNLYFNAEEYNYDGGACCAGTCRGEDCGNDDLPDPFLGIVPVKFDLSSYFARDRFFWFARDCFYPFRNVTEDWKNAFLGRKYAYGVNMDENLLVPTSEPPRRFSHCADRNSALLRLEQKGTSYSEDWTLLAGTTLRCDLTLFLSTPMFTTINNRPNRIFKEEVRVPYGARCTFGVTVDSGLDSNEISIFAENQTVPFLQQNFSGYGRTKVIMFRIPESECVWNVLVENNISPIFTDLDYEEFVNGVDLNSMCDQERGEVLDRYWIWKIMKSGKYGDLFQKFKGHMCDLNDSNFRLKCADNRRVSQLSFRDLGYTLVPSEFGNLTLLESLDITGYGNTTLAALLPTEIGTLAALKSLGAVRLQLTSIPSEIGNLASLTSLSFNFNKLTSIPSEIGKLTSLTRLSLNFNKLTSIPSEIGKLTSLQYLGLRFNPMTSDSLPIQVPSEIGTLTLLEELDLSNTKLTSIPSEIGNLALLEELDLSNNKLTSIPSEIGNLASLKRLYLDSNTLTSIPSEIGNLASLTDLVLSNNNLTSIPSEIGNLASLKTLYLKNNTLTLIPSEIGNLASLGELELSYNDLTTIPSEIGNLASLGDLDLSYNDLTSIPSEIGKLTSLEYLDLGSNPMGFGSLPMEVQTLSQTIDEFFVCQDYGQYGCLSL